ARRRPTPRRRARRRTRSPWARAPPGAGCRGPGRSCAAPRAVLVVLRLDERAHALPVGVGEPVELGEVAARAGGERAGAVEHDGLAGEPVAAVRHEENGEVAQLLHAAE